MTADIIVFSVDDYLIGIDLSVVDRVIRAVEISLIPEASVFCSGIINVHGEIVPVINVRKILGLKDRNLELNDQFILCVSNQKKMALWIDHSTKIMSAPKDNGFAKEDLLLGIPGVKSIVKENHHMIFIYEIETFAGKL